MRRRSCGRIWLPRIGGLRPASRVTFLVRPRKVTKRGRPNATARCAGTCAPRTIRGRSHALRLTSRKTSRIVRSASAEAKGGGKKGEKKRFGRPPPCDAAGMKRSLAGIRGELFEPQASFSRAALRNGMKGTRQRRARRSGAFLCFVSLGAQRNEGVERGRNPAILTRVGQKSAGRVPPAALLFWYDPEK